METRSIYFKSDFLVRLTNEFGWSNPFSIRFFTTRAVSALMVGYNGTTYKGCSVDSETGALMVPFERFTEKCRQGLGVLKMEVTFRVPNAVYPDQWEDKVMAVQPVVVTNEDGESFWLSLGLTGDEDVEVGTQVIAPYKGAKGDKGDKGDPGETGPQGPKGDKGDKGDTGAAGTNGTNGINGVDGEDAYQPFKGWYDSSSALSSAYPSPQVGDFAYVRGATSADPVAIYACATAGTWADSGNTFNPSNNQEFASGEALNVTHIVDNLNSSSATDVLSAKQGKVLDEKIGQLGLKIDELDAQINGGESEEITTQSLTAEWGDYGYIHKKTGVRSGSASTTNKTCDYIDISGFGGGSLTYLQCKYSAASGNAAMAFYNSSKTFISSDAAVYGASDNGYQERTVDIPSNAAYVRFTFLAAQLENFSASVSKTTSTHTNGLANDIEDIETELSGHGTRLTAVEEAQESIGNIIGESTDTPKTASFPFSWKGAYYVDYTDGTITSSPVNHCTDYINISEYAGGSLTYTRLKNTLTSGSAGMAFYDRDKHYISGQTAVYGASSYGYESTTIDIPSNAAYIRCTMRDSYMDDFEASGAITERIYTSGIGKDVQELNATKNSNSDRIISLEDKAVRLSMFNTSLEHIEDLSSDTSAFTPKTNPYGVFLQISDLFDDLVDDYPNIVTKQDAGTLVGLTYPSYANLDGATSSQGHATPTYKTYIYTFSIGETAIEKKKILLIGGVHGKEYCSSIDLALFAQKLCGMESANFAKLLMYCDIYIIPCLNGYGLLNFYQQNGNGVNLNRNFPTDGWQSEGAGTANYSGESAGSEFETQLVMGIVNYLHPSFVIDHHNYDAQNTPLNVETTAMFKHAASLAKADMLKELQSEYPQYFGSSMAATFARSLLRKDVTSATSGYGRLRQWCNAEGVPAILIEVPNHINYDGGTYSPITSTQWTSVVHDINYYTTLVQILHYTDVVI